MAHETVIRSSLLVRDVQNPNTATQKFAVFTGSGNNDLNLLGFRTPTELLSDIGFNEAVDDRVSTLIQAGANISVTYDDDGNTLIIAAPNTVTGSGTATQIAFWKSGSTTELTSSSNLYWDNVNGRLGVGINTPSARYHQSQTQGTFARYDITNPNADQNRGVWEFYTNTAITPDFFGRFGFKFEGGVNNAAKHFQLHVNDATNPRLIINGNGNVGISTITPNARLQVQGADTSDTGWTAQFHNSLGNSNSLMIRDDGNVGIGTSGTTARFVVRASGSSSGSTTMLVENSGGTAMLTVREGGNVGVGTSSPNSRLQINAFGTGSTTSTLLIQNSATTTIFSVRENGDLYGRSGIFYLGSDGRIYTNRLETNTATTGSIEIVGGYTGTRSIAFGTFTSVTKTSGNYNVTEFSSSGFNPTSGNGTFNIMSVGVTINQTGGASGTTRGVYIQPTLTSAFDWRSIEWNNDSGFGLYGAGSGTNYLNGNLGIKTTTPAQTLHVAGTMRLTGNAGTATEALGRDANGDLSGVPFSTIVASGGGVSGSGTATQVAFWGGTTGSTSTALSGSSNLYWDNVNSRLGVGTASPSHRLHILGPSARVENSSGTFEFDIVGGGTTSRIVTTATGMALGTLSNNALIFWMNASERMRINSSTGHVGINQNAPAARLHVVGSSTGTTAWTAQFHNSGGTSNSLMIRDDGNVGIGTDAPATRLDVRGTGTIFQVTNSSDSKQVFRVTDSGWFRIGNGGNSPIIFPQTNLGGTSNIDGTNLVFFNYTTSQSASFGKYHFRGETSTQTSGDNSCFYILERFSPPSGNATSTAFYVRSEINQTAGGTGITRGLSLVPSLVNAVQYQTIHWNTALGTNNWGLYGEGTALNYLQSGLSIGTTSSAARLHVVGSSTGTTAWTAQFHNSGGTSNSLMIRDDGNVAIGNSSPNARLQVQGADTSNSNWTAQFHNSLGNSNSLMIRNDGNVGIGTTGTTARLVVRASGSSTGSTAMLVENSGGTSMLMVREDGNVGVGTSSPVDKLHVTGAIRSSVSGAFANFTAYNPAGGYPRAQFIIGNSASDVNTGFIVSPSKDGIPVSLEVGNYSNLLNTNYKAWSINVSSASNILASYAGTGEAASPQGNPIYIATRFNNATTVPAIFINNTNDQQVAINTPTPDSSTQFQINSTTRGFLPPRMTTTQRDAIATPATGLQIYNTTLNVMQHYNGTTWVSEAGGSGGTGTVSGSGTATQVAFWGGTTGSTSTALSGSSNLYWDGVNGRLGVGTSTPSAPLTIKSYGNSVSTNEAFSIFNSATTPLNLLTVLENGNIGVGGQTSPIYKLDILGNLRLGTSSVQFGIGESGGNSVILGSLTNHPYRFIVNTNEAARFTTDRNLSIGATGSTARLLVVSSQPSGTTTWTAQFHNALGNSNSLMIRDDGNVGIGTDSPIAKIDVRADIGSVAFFGSTAGSRRLEVQSNGNVLLGLVGWIPTTNGGVDTNIGAGGCFIGYNATSDLAYAVTSVTLGRPLNRLLNATTGGQKMVDIVGNFSPTSGNATFYDLGVIPTINQTGGASGTTRGLFVNPLLTSAADWRSIEWTNNTGWGIYGSGTAKSYFAGNVAIGTTTQNASSILELSSTTQGFLPPRMSTANRNLISSPATGLQVYNSSLNVMQHYNGVSWVNEANPILTRVSTGTTQVELFLDGVSSRFGLVGTNKVWNFRIQLCAIVASAGTGTLDLSDSYISEHLIGIKRSGSSINVVGGGVVQNLIGANTQMEDSVVTITGDSGTESLRVFYTPPSGAAANTVIRISATLYYTEAGV